MGRPERVTREQVLAAAREIFAARGFEGATLAAIAARLALSPAALLRHAPTKQALFDAAMAAAESPFPLPLEFLAELDAARRDPAEVLREIGERFVPFIEKKLGETIVLWLRSNVLAAAPALESALPAIDRLPLLFDRDRHPTPPERALALVEGYFRRARRAGRLELADPKAAAIAFLASLHSYVALHRLVRAIDPPLPLARYLDTLIAVWTTGAIRKGASGVEAPFAATKPPEPSRTVKPLKRSKTSKSSKPGAPKPRRPKRPGRSE